MNSKQEPQVGDEVFCRDHEKSSWLSGVVVSLQPFEIQVQGWPIPMSFNFVCQNVTYGQIGHYVYEQADVYEQEYVYEQDPESHEETILQTYVCGEYRFKYPSLVRKELDQTSEIIRHLATNDVVHVKNIQLHDSRVRAQIKGGGFVTLYNFITNREMATKDVVKESDWEISKDKVHLIQERGENMRAIRDLPYPQIIKEFDEKTFTIEDLKAMKLDRYNCLVRITAKSYASKCAQMSTRDLLTKLIQQEEKRIIQAVKPLQKQNLPQKRLSRSDCCNTNLVVCENGKKEANPISIVTGLSGKDPVDASWEMQKQQHGANGCWETRKFKNKGKHRAALRGKAWKRNYRWQKSKQHTRKPKRKYTIELPNNRRLSL